MFSMSWIHFVWPHGSLVPYGTRLYEKRLIMEQVYTKYKVFYKLCKVYTLCMLKGVQGVTTL